MKSPLLRRSLRWARPVNLMVLAEALIVLASASAAIRLLPFRRVVELASRIGGGGEADADLRREKVGRCRWAIERWSSIVPWKTVCFQKGLALHIMLRWRGVPSMLHYGVAQDTRRGVSAHVWLSESGSIILGGEVAGEYRCLATFP